MKIGIVVGGSEYYIGNGTLAWLEDDDGLGMTPLHRWATSGVLQEGETDQGYKLDPRSIMLKLGVETESKSLLAARRDLLARIFAPGKVLTIKCYRDDGAIRQIEANYVGGLSMAGKDRSGPGMHATVMLRAPSPLFYDPNMQVVEFTLYSLGMSVPTLVPTLIAESVLNKQTTIAYTGSWRSRPFVRVFGPITNLEIDNLTTGEKLAVKSGVTIGGGDYYEFDPGYDAQTVIDAAGANQIDDLSNDSDLATFHLAESEDGSDSRDNTIRVTGSGVTSATKIQLFYYRNYLNV